MALDRIECRIRFAGGVVAMAVLGTILMGLLRGLQRPLGRRTGRETRLLRSPFFLLLASTGYFGLAAILWRPLPLHLSRLARATALIAGTPLYFSGLVLVLWGRLALGRMYDVSSSLGARLYADHTLITHGPFAIVRHPMYLGLLLTAFGGLLLYRTGSCLFFLANFPVLILRARREERVLAEEFGRQWRIYCQQVPAWLPQLPNGAKRNVESCG